MFVWLLTVRVFLGECEGPLENGRTGNGDSRPRTLVPLLRPGGALIIGIAVGGAVEVGLGFFVGLGTLPFILAPFADGLGNLPCWLKLRCTFALRALPAAADEGLKLVGGALP